MTTGNGITNIDIEKFFENETNDDLKKNFMGVYSSDSITKYINFYEIINEKRAKYPFAIFNTDRENKPGMCWWSFLDIFPKKKTCHYSIALILLVLSNLLLIMTAQL